MITRCGRRGLKLWSAMVFGLATAVTVAQAQITIFYETMGTVGGTTTIASHETANGFDNDALTMTDGAASNAADIRATSVSAGYTNSAGSPASGAANVFFTSTAGERGFAIGGINAAAYSNITVEFGYRKEAAGTNATLIFQWSTNSGAAWNDVALSNLPSNTASVAWYLLSASLPNSAAGSSLSLRWLKQGSTSLRVDDVLLKGLSGSAPSLSITNPLTGTSYPDSTSSVDVSGTANASVVGQLVWTNAFTGGSGTSAASASWTIAAIPLGIGTNLITVIGTNSASLSSQDSITIIRQAAAVTNVSFAIASFSISESGGPAYDVVIKKSLEVGSVSGTLTLSGTATEGAFNDFTISDTNFTISGAATTTTVTIFINDDTDEEPAETIVLDLANVVGGTVVSPSTFTLTIQANDAPPPAGGIVWINEINYDEPGTDTNEFVEIAGPAGTDLSPYAILLYNGANGAVYASNALSGTIDDEGCGYGAVSFAAAGIQNGAPDGVALVSNGVTVLQFLSYEGSFVGTDGAAVGITSVDVGSQFGVEQTLQLQGTGSTYSAFTWIDGTTNGFGESPGTLNLNQFITPCGGGSTTIDEFFATKVTQSGGSISVTINASSNGVPYTLYYSTNLITSPAPAGSGTADSQNGNGGALILQDTTPPGSWRSYWIRSN